MPHRFCRIKTQRVGEIEELGEINSTVPALHRRHKRLRPLKAQSQIALGYPGCFPLLGQKFADLNMRGRGEASCNGSAPLEDVSSAYQMLGVTRNPDRRSIIKIELDLSRNSDYGSYMTIRNVATQRTLDALDLRTDTLDRLAAMTREVIEQLTVSERLLTSACDVLKSERKSLGLAPKPKAPKAPVELQEAEMRRDIIWIAQVATDLGMKTSAIHQMIRKRMFPAPVVGRQGKIAFAKSDIERWKVQAAWIDQCAAMPAT